MKQIVISKQGKHVQVIGDTYTTPQDTDIFQITGEEVNVHDIDGARYDWNGFQHFEVSNIPQNVLDNPSGFKYENGEFIATYAEVNIEPQEVI